MLFFFSFIKMFVLFFTKFCSHTHIWFYIQKVCGAFYIHGVQDQCWPFLWLEVLILGFLREVSSANANFSLLSFINIYTFYKHESKKILSAVLADSSLEQYFYTTLELHKLHMFIVKCLEHKKSVSFERDTTITREYFETYVRGKSINIKKFTLSEVHKIYFIKMNIIVRVSIIV